MIRFGTPYHNGIVERSSADRFGTEEGGFLTDVVEDCAALQALLTEAARGDMTYPNLLSDAHPRPCR